MENKPETENHNLAKAATTKVDVDNRIIYLTGGITEESAQTFVSRLFELESKDPLSDILVFVDSYGGYVDSFFTIHDSIKLCRCDVATVAIGKAMSAGQMILISGTAGKRFATKNARIMVHQLAGGIYGKMHELDNEVIEARRQQKQLDSLILEYTTMNKKKLAELMSKDSYLTAEEALQLGIIDHIISKPKDLYSIVKI